MLQTTGAAALGAAMFPVGSMAAAEQGRQRVLYFTRNVGYYQSVVQRQGDALSHSERALVDMGKRIGVEIVCTEDGRVFDDDLDQYDAVAFYTSVDLTTPGESVANSAKVDPYIAMIGGEFIAHGPRQEATMRVSSPSFPGMGGDCYRRPSYPSTWARMRGGGRVFFTSMGHRANVWGEPPFQPIVLGGLAWVLGRVDADVAPNIDDVTPAARQLKR